jgi:hypothetical protein
MKNLGLFMYRSAKSGLIVTELNGIYYVSDPKGRAVNCNALNDLKAAKQRADNGLGVGE